MTSNDRLRNLQRRMAPNDRIRNLCMEAGFCVDCIDCSEKV